MKPVKERNPECNIVAVDYDAGATRINQENRIKLMLSCAAEKERAKKTANAQKLSTDGAEKKSEAKEPVGIA